MLNIILIPTFEPFSLHILPFLESFELSFPMPRERKREILEYHTTLTFFVEVLHVCEVVTQG